MPSPDPPALQNLDRIDQSSPEFHSRLSDALYGEEYQQCVPNLRDGDLVWLVDYLDKALGCLEPSSAASRKCLRELRTVCGARGILPPSYTLSPHLLNISPEPFASGGYGDVYMGSLDASSVCVKRIRAYTSDDPQKATKIFCQEAVVWKRLTHPNVLPLLGVTVTPFQLVSNWMSGGDLPDFLKKNPDADRLALLSDVARGLSHLHSCNVIHGDLKGPNVLVDHSGNALIADFGLATVTQNLDSIQSATHRVAHTPRWAAPEVLMEGTFSKEADIFSFAMVMIEVFTGAIPFSDKPPTAAMLNITQGRRPPRPTDPTFTTELWTLMERCWDQSPHLRPEASEVLAVLPGVSAAGIPQREGTSDEVASATTETAHNVVLSDEPVPHNTVEHEPRESQQIEASELPPIRRLDGEVTRMGAHPYAGGTYCEIWEGLWRKHGQGAVGREALGEMVALKVLREPHSSDATHKRLEYEIQSWPIQWHQNLLPFYGIVTDIEERLYMVTPWQGEGDLFFYVKKNPGADKDYLLRGSAAGLAYLHSRGVIHGSVKCRNVLVSLQGEPQICDFGIAGVVEGTSTPRRLSGDIVRYAAPELLENISAHATTSSDVCSFAMLVLECITEEIPFSNLSRDAVVVHARVSRRESPPRPDGQSTKGQVSDGLWDLMTRCWAYQPDRRPAMEDVHGFFQLQHPISDFVTPRGSSSRGYTIDSMGTNNQGNHYSSRDYGNGMNSYRYSNQDGGYYYANPDGSTYYNDGRGGVIYTPP